MAVMMRELIEFPIGNNNNNNLICIVMKMSLCCVHSILPHIEIISIISPTLPKLFFEGYGYSY